MQCCKKHVNLSRLLRTLSTEHSIFNDSFRTAHIFMHIMCSIMLTNWCNWLINPGRKNNGSRWWTPPLVIETTAGFSSTKKCLISVIYLHELRRSETCVELTAESMGREGVLGQKVLWNGHWWLQMIRWRRYSSNPLLALLPRLPTSNSAVDLS